MEVLMKYQRSCFVFICFVFFLVAVPIAYAEVEWNLLSTINLEKKPLDIASSADGKWTYILTSGEVLIYSQRKKALAGRVPVDLDANRITVSPKGDRLFVTNLKKKNFSVINVSFRYQFDLTGTPFLGSADAPVVIAVFEDFQ